MRLRAAAFGGAGNLGASLGKELLLLELDAFPRRIPQHHVETAVSRDRKHLRELDVPVEEAVLRRQPVDLRERRLADAGRVARDAPQHALRDRRRLGDPCG